MEHMLLKAATTATDQGVFEAIISAATIDREKDIVDPAGMVRALQAWQKNGKKIPLAWNHSTAASDQIGYVDPGSARVIGNEVAVGGWIDQSTPTGADAWRQVKMGTLGFSFGYLVPEGGSTPRKGGGYHITELDVFEVTATPTPMNPDTRVLTYKGAVIKDELHRHGKSDLKAAATGVSLQTLNSMLALAQRYIDRVDDSEDADEMRSIVDDLKELIADRDDAADRAEDADDGKSLRRRADAMVLEITSGGASGRKAPKLEPEAEPEPEPERDVAALREKADRLTAELEEERNAKRIADIPEPEPEFAVLHLTHEEMAGLAEGDLKAVWSAAFINTLPDSAFLYIESGGDRDPEGKTTPRSLRHFPYKDASGTVDLPHLRNALARIPQSNLSSSIKDQLTAKAQKILDAQKSVDVADKETKSRSADPLRARADAVALEVVSGGESLRKPPRVKEKPPPRISVSELRRQMHQAALDAMTGGLTDEQV